MQLVLRLGYGGYSKTLRGLAVIGPTRRSIAKE